MWLAAGDRARASELARTVISRLHRDVDDSYYGVATEAEAQLLLDNTAEAAELLRRAGQRHDGDFGALATTRRQLRFDLFSKLSDEQLPAFTTRVLGAFAAVVDRYGDHVGHRNTWGDAV